MSFDVIRPVSLCCDTYGAFAKAPNLLGKQKCINPYVSDCKHDEKPACKNEKSGEDPAPKTSVG